VVLARWQAEAATAPAEICRKMGISEQTLHQWKKKYDGMGVAELRELKHLRHENRRLKQVTVFKQRQKESASWRNSKHCSSSV
jgi:putative transposase